MESREWMYHWLRFLSPYRNEVAKFIGIAKVHAEKNNMRKIICPCADCKNEIVWDFDDAFKVKEHLVTRGFMDKYEIWTRHGEEQVDEPENVVPTQVEDMVHDDGYVEDKIDLEEMLRHAEPEVLMGSARGLNNFEALQKAAKEVLYDESKGCDSDFTTLRSVLELMRLKARHGWSDTSFDSLLKLLQKMLPRPNSLPSSTYQAKKLICPFHLVWKRFMHRITRIYSNPRDAELMRWHEEGRKKDGMIRHPADARQWINFNAQYREFAKDPRNIRFALSTDGVNPFGDMSSSHSTWPVLLTMYNLPTWLCQKRKYVLLCILIQGPRQPGIDIDVFLEPLLEDMADLWKEGLKVWDEYLREYFTVKAIIFVTINDYLAMFSVSGQIKGKTGCVICLNGTYYRYLPGSNKLVYMRHRRFLRTNHKYRKMKAEFDGTEETDPAPKPTSGENVCAMTEKIVCEFGKMTKKPSKGTKRKKPEKNTKGGDSKKQDDSSKPDDKLLPPFKKHSIFFKYLPYWKDLEVRHAINVMHLEKNVFDNIVGTLLDMPKKTKDGLQSRMDLIEMGIREELHPQEGEKNGKVYLPPACFTLTPEEKKSFCNSLRNVRVPIGFSSNISRLVSMKDLSVSGYNSHDCHVLLTVFLAIAIRAIKPEHLKVAITRLCYFFNVVSQKVISLEELGNLRTFAHETQCQLEMCFPPSFFDMMEHLIVHIVPQMVAFGPLYLHQMWSYERYMAVLKGYVRNRAHPEGSMVEGYSTEEVVECCIDYLKDGYAIGFAIVEPYIDQHIELIRANNKGRSTEWIMKEHKRLFIDWLRDLDLPEGETTDEITMKRLACGPSTTVNSWQGYDINGYSFSTRARDNKTCTQNSGVRVEAIDDAGEKQSYFGFIEEIWEIDYGHTMQFPIFKCQWVKYPNGVNVDKFGLTVVDHARVGHKDDPWVLANRVAQVFYVKDPSNLKKDIVLPGKQKILGVDGVEDVEDYNQYDSMPLYSQFVQKIKNVETSTQKTVKPYMRTDGVGKNVKG
uniref:B1248C03.2 protein n=1 Tax=Oryza sativa subsp. japonica TaxID=39947 RepID=Q7XXM2_ORYSJ|nr:OSJNBa0042N22.16 [Oryza sativa Japonica Group]CAE76043.1 B1248C03.2 [Oryza sativa Japonica Group]